MNICYICGSKNYIKREGQVRDKSELDVLECSNCGLVYLSSIEHINDNFYMESGMLSGQVDINRYRVNSQQDDERRFNVLQPLIQNKKLLDFGCGAGGFLKMAQNWSTLVHGVELDQKINRYLNEQEEIRVLKNISDLEEKYDIITLFHVLEHLPDPIQMLEHLSEHLAENGEIIVEVPSASDALLTLYKSKSFSRFTYWSCHLFLFNESTLSTVAKRAGLKVKYVKQIQRYPLSNHLYWLANEKPGGHQYWSFLDSPILKEAYENQLASIGKCDTLIASFVK